MATKVWIGGAQAISQVDHATPDGVQEAAVYSLTVNHKTISYTAENGDGVAEVIAGLVAAWEASELPEVAEITATDGTDYVILTGTEGVPFVVTGTAAGGSGAQSEIQTITLANVIGGTFTLTFSGQTTTAIAWDASAATVQTALEALSNVAAGGVDLVVTGSAGGPYTVTFQDEGAYGLQNVSAITASAANLTGLTIAASITVETEGTDGDDEIQSIEITHRPTAGTWQIGFGGQTTSGLAYDAAPGTVETALEGLTTIGANNVLVGGTTGEWQITFQEALAAAPQELLDVTTHGNGAGVAVSVVQEGTAGAVCVQRVEWQTLPSESEGAYPGTGTWTITFSANTTSALGPNPTSAEVETALNALASITAAGGVTVGIFGIFVHRYWVTIPAGAVEEFTIDHGIANGLAYAQRVQLHADAADQVFEIRQPFAPTSGTWSITFASTNTTSSLAHDASAATVETALNALTDPDTFAVSKSGRTYLVTCGGAYGEQALAASWLTVAGALNRVVTETGTVVHLATGRPAKNQQYRVFAAPYPNAGTWTISCGGQTTSSLQYNANAATIDAAVEALSTVGTGNAICTTFLTSIGYATVEYAGTLATSYGPVVSVPGHSLRRTPGVNVTRELAGATERLQTQRISFDHAPGAGTWTISYSGQTTSSLAHNADAPTIEAALEDLSTIVAVSVTVGTTIDVEFADPKTDVSALTVDDSALTYAGTTPSVSADEEQVGRGETTQQDTLTGYNGAASGTFRLDLGGGLGWFDFDYDTPASTVNTTLSPYGGTVTGSTLLSEGGSYTITWGSGQSPTVSITQSSGDCVNYGVSKTRDRIAPQNAIWTITLTGDCDEGSQFAVTVDSATPFYVDYDVSAGDLETAINNSASCETTIGYTTGTWTIEFDGTDANEYHSLSVDGTDLIALTDLPVTATVTEEHVSYVAEQQEIQSVLLSGCTPSTGHLHLSDGTNTSAEIAYNAAPAAVQTALDNATPAAIDVTVLTEGDYESGTLPGGTVYVEFDEPGSQSYLTVDVTAIHEPCTVTTRVVQQPQTPVTAVQQVTLPTATGGTWRLHYPGTSLYSSSLAPNASAATVQTGLTPINALWTVAGDAGGPYTITLDATARPLLELETTALTVSFAPIAEVYSTGHAEIPEIQIVAFWPTYHSDGTTPYPFAVAGTWTITHNSETTSTLARGCEAADVQTALRALTGFSDVTVRSLEIPHFELTFNEVGPRATLTAVATDTYNWGDLASTGLVNVQVGPPGDPGSVLAQTWLTGHSRYLPFGWSPYTAGTATVVTFEFDAAATSGTWAITYSGQTTSALTTAPSAATVQSALLGLSNLGDDDLTVERSADPPYTYTVTFAGAKQYGPEALSLAGSTLRGPLVLPETPVSTTQAPVAGTNEIYEIRYGGAAAPTSGTWSITVGGQTTSSLTPSHSAAEIKAAIVSLASISPDSWDIGSSDLDVTGDLTTQPILVEYKGHYAGTTGPVTTVTSALAYPGSVSQGIAQVGSEGQSKSVWIQLDGRSAGLGETYGLDDQTDTIVYAPLPNPTPIGEPFLFTFDDTADHALTPVDPEVNPELTTSRPYPEMSFEWIRTGGGAKPLIFTLTGATLTEQQQAGSAQLKVYWDDSNYGIAGTLNFDSSPDDVKAIVEEALGDRPFTVDVYGYDDLDQVCRYPLEFPPGLFLHEGGRYEICLTRTDPEYEYPSYITFWAPISDYVTLYTIAKTADPTDGGSMLYRIESPDPPAYSGTWGFTLDGDPVGDQLLSQLATVEEVQLQHDRCFGPVATVTGQPGSWLIEWGDPGTSMAIGAYSELLADGYWLTVGDVEDEAIPERVQVEEFSSPDATDGTFDVTVNSKTATVNWDDSPTAVQSALTGASITEIEVMTAAPHSSSTLPAGPLFLGFVTVGEPVLEITIDDADLLGEAVELEIDVAQDAGGGATPEIQEITLGQSPVAGTWTITITPAGGTPKTTSALPYNATAAQLQTALRALDLTGAAGISVATSGNAYTYAVTFGGALAGRNMDPASLANNLTQTVTVSVDVTAGTWPQPALCYLRWSDFGGIGLLTQSPDPTTECRLVVDDSVTEPFAFFTATAAEIAELVRVLPSVAGADVSVVTYGLDPPDDNYVNRWVKVYVSKTLTTGIMLIESPQFHDGTLADPDYRLADVAEVAKFDGTPAADEIQEVEVYGAPTGGTWTLALGGQTTSSLAPDAAAATVETALQALSTIGAGNVEVTGDAGGPYTIAFAEDLAAQAVATLAAADTLVGLPPQADVTRLVAGAEPADEVQRLAIANATGGTYTLSLSGQSTGSIAWNAAAETIQSRLEGLTTIGAGNVAVAETAGEFLITFQGALSETAVPTLGTNSSALTGPAKTIAIATPTPGHGEGELTVETITEATGPSFWDNVDNWDGGVLPVTGDTVYVGAAAAGPKYALDQSGVVLARLVMTRDADDVQIGLPQINEEGGYVEYRPQYLQIGATEILIEDSAGVVRIDCGANQFTATIVSTGAASADYEPAVNLLGTHTGNVLHVAGGDVGLAYFPGETSKAATIRQSGGTVYVGEDVTLVTYDKQGGTAEIRSTCTTFTQHGLTGTTTAISAEPTTLSVQSGTYVWKGGGTITTVTVGGAGTITANQDPRLKTATNWTYQAGATLNDHAETITFTNAPVFQDCTEDDVTINRGNDAGGEA